MDRLYSLMEAVCVWIEVLDRRGSEVDPRGLWVKTLETLQNS